MNLDIPPGAMPEPDFKILVDLSASPVRVHLTGELDAATAGSLGRVLDRLRDQGHRQIAVDVESLRFLGAAGLREFVRTSRSLRERGGRLTLTNLTPARRRMLDITGHGDALTEEAVADPVAPVGVLTCVVEGARGRIVVRGAIDARLLADLGARVAALAAAGVRQIVVDLSEVTACGPELVPALADACRVLRERHGRLRPVGGAGCVTAALDLATPTDLFALYQATGVAAQRRSPPAPMPAAP